LTTVNKIKGINAKIQDKTFNYHNFTTPPHRTMHKKSNGENSDLTEVMPELAAKGKINPPDLSPDTTGL
jgi:hypothetical protein